MPTSFLINAPHSARQAAVLFATDLKGTVVVEVLAGEPYALAYSVYGHQSSKQPALTRLGFNGELREAIPQRYLLGNGHRAYNPTLMRFHSADNLSPFGDGGLNAYAYCGGEPVMNVDPTGQSFWSTLFKVLDFFSLSNTSSGPRRNALGVQPKSGNDGLWAVAGGVAEHISVMKKAPTVVSNGEKARTHKSPSWKGSQRTPHSATPPQAINQPKVSGRSARTGVVLKGNYGVRPQNEFSTVRTRDGLSISGVDSGTRQIPSSSRSVTVADIRRR